MRRALISKIIVGAIVTLLLAVRPVGPTGADGSEALGPPSIPIATGTGVVSDGTGLHTQPGQVTLNVPANAQVKQVLAYWECLQEDASGAGVGADDTISINGQPVTGKNIGQRYFFGPVYSASFRADITDRGFVGSGVTNLSISDLNCSFAANGDGASIVVIFDDGGPAQIIDIRDGNDNAYRDFSAPVDTTTPVVYNVPAQPFDRVVDLTLLVGGVDYNRPNAVKITVGNNPPQLLTNVLNSTDGNEWDDVTIPVAFAAGETTLTVQLLSTDNGTGNQPASISWVASILSVDGTPDPCIGDSGTPQSTSGKAWGVDARVLTLELIDKLGYVSTSAPPTATDPTHESKTLLEAKLNGLVAARVEHTESFSHLNPPRTTSSASLADVSLLNGLVKATAVRGVSSSVAAKTHASYNSVGSAVVGLLVNGKPVVVAPNTTVAVKLLGITIAELGIYKEKGSSSFADGVSKASHSVDMLTLTLLKPFLGYGVGTKVVLSHAESKATGPIAKCPDEHEVSGHAFTAYADGLVGGKLFLGAKVGEAKLPKTGGADFDGTIVNFPGIITSATAANSTSGSLTPNPHAQSRSVVEKANVLGGLVTADILNVGANSFANGTSAATNFDATFVNLKVAGVAVAANVGPNTKIVVNISPLLYAVVTLNERHVSGNGTTDTEGTINAVHVRLYAVGGLLKGEVIVASAHSDAHV